MGKFFLWTLTTAIKIAILQNFRPRLCRGFFISGPMYDSTEQISRVYMIARDVLDKLTIGPSDGEKPCISIEQLQDVIAAETGCEIRKFEVPFEATHTRERVERYKDGKLAIIHVRQDQELHWKRFVTAKALLHIKVDREEDFSAYGDQTLEELIRRGHFGQLSSRELSGEPAHSEVLAEMAALEVLYPLDMRKQDVEDMGNKETTIIKIAHKYGIPPSYAATALDPIYLTQLIKCFRAAVAA